LPIDVRSSDADNSVGENSHPRTNSESMSMIPLQKLAQFTDFSEENI